MNVLLIAYHFPPDPAVGSLRAARVAETFVRAGDDVTLLAGPLAGPAMPDPPGMRVIRVTNQFDLRGLYARLRRRAPDSPSASGTTTSARWAPPSRVPFWKRALFSLLWLPDDRQGWIAPVVWKALSILRKRPALLYTTAPPFSAHVAGWLIASLSGARWAAEFRDPWTDNPWKPWFVRTRMSDALDRWLERRCLRRAHHVITVTESAGRLLARRMGEHADRLAVVRSGIVPLTGAPATARTDDVTRILYVGNLYHARDPGPFIAALGALRRAGTLPPVEIRLVGNCRWFQGQSVEALCREAGIDDLVAFSDPVPHDACLRLIQNADLLLLLAQDQPVQVPNKLYEYLAARRRILAFADADGETATMLRTVGGHSIVTDGDPGAERILLEALRAARQGAHETNDTILEEWSADAQMTRLRDTLREAS